MDPTSRARGAHIKITEDGRTLWHIPLGDLILQTELRVATEGNIQAYPCPCVNCHGGIRKTINVIREHHTSVGRDPFLTKSIIGGDPLDGYPPQGMWVEDIPFDDDIVEPNIDVQGNTDDGENFKNSDSVGIADVPLDQFHNVHRQVMEALDRGDALHRENLASSDMSWTTKQNVTLCRAWRSCTSNAPLRCTRDRSAASQRGVCDNRHHEHVCCLWCQQQLHL
jgi:hypothetical protein